MAFRRWWRTRLQGFVKGDEGQAIVWVAVMLPLFLSVIGLSIDGGLVFSARRELQNVADGAARSGAMQVAEQAYRESSGQRVVLDVEAAQAVAVTYVAQQRRDFSATVQADPRVIVVQVARDVPTSFLRLVGIQSAYVTATATAVARAGIERGNP